MAGDSDLAALLPEPPPPRPAQREIALETAMHRFDGHDDPPRTGTRGADPNRSGRWLARHQFVSLATMAVVALFSSSIWLSQGERFAEPPEIATPRRVETPAPRARETTATPEALSRPAAEPAPAEGTQERETGIAPVPAPAPAPPGDRAAPAQADASIVVQGRRISRPDFESASPMVTVDAEQLNRLPTLAAEPAKSSAESRSEDRSIVVTGGRVQRPSAPTAVAVQRVASTDLTACTVADPARNLRACRRLADPAARGSTGRAAAQLADGLSLAWEGQLDRAIEAFDRAISTAPDLSIAYLNRGLAYQLKGDLARARADMDRAIAADPDAARGYYHRSQLRQASGDAAGAEADARRSTRLERND